MSKPAQVFAFVFFALALASPAPATPIADLAALHNAAQVGLSSYQKGDLAAAEKTFADALAHGPQQPKILFYLAAAAARQGERDKALALLERYAEMGFAMDAPANAAFAGLENLPAYLPIKARMAANLKPVCACATIFEGRNQPFLAEGIAHDDATDRLFVGSIYKRQIVAIVKGRQSVFIPSLPQSYSPLGMTVDRRRNHLWVSAAVLPQAKHGPSSQADTSALIAFDPTNGALQKIYPAPAKLELNDVALGPDGTVYVSDSEHGLLFRLLPGAEALSPFGAADALASAQGMATSVDGRYLLVADYAMGLQRIDLTSRSGKVERVRVPANMTTLGIDGLARLPDGAFIATQNGFKTARIVRLRLARDWSAVLSLDVVAANTSDVSDPTLVTVVGSDAYVIGVSQWASFGDDKPEPVGVVRPWKIVRLDLR